LTIWTTIFHSERLFVNSGANCRGAIPGAGIYYGPAAHHTMGKECFTLSALWTWIGPLAIVHVLALCFIVGARAARGAIRLLTAPNCPSPACRTSLAHALYVYGHGGVEWAVTGGDRMCASGFAVD
jgi:hypothetical protein